MRRRMIVLVSVILASLLVTTSVAAAPATTSSSAPTAWGAPGYRYHVVRFGETLFSIGRMYGVSPWAIASANHLPNWNRIYAGQCLYIPPYTTYYGGCRYVSYGYGCRRYPTYGCCGSY